VIDRRGGRGDLRSSIFVLRPERRERVRVRIITFLTFHTFLTPIHDEFFEKQSQYLVRQTLARANLIQISEIFSLRFDSGLLTCEYFLN
jgi:hypothetical protein